MNRQKKKTFSAVIPAYNEASTIRAVLNALVASRRFEQIIVVDDGSNDATATAAAGPGVHVIIQKNAGKSAAMVTGASAVQSSHIVFFDADLVGLHIGHVTALLKAVENGADMAIGLRDRGAFWNALMKTIFPKIGGERCVRRSDFLLMARGVRGFGIESAMNAYCRKRGLPVALVPMRGVRHTLKEKKYGFFQGFVARCAMIAEVVIAEVRVRVFYD